MSLGGLGGQGAGNWRSLAAVFAGATALDLAAWGQLQAFTPIFLRTELHLAPDEVSRWTGILAALMLAVALPLAPLWGAFADRWGRKPVILRGYAISVIAYLITATAQNVEQLAIARLLWGFSFGTQAVVLAAQADVTPEDRIASAVSFIQMMFPLGTSLGPLYGGFLGATLGLRSIFLLNACQSALAFTLIYWLYQDRTVRDRSPLGAKVRQTLSSVVRAGELRAIFTTIFLFAVGAAMLDPYVPVYLDRLYVGNGVAAFVGITMSVFGIIAGCLTPVAGRLADTLGRARVFGWSLLALAALATAMALLPTATADPALTLAGLQIVRGIPQAGTIGLAYTLVLLFVPATKRASIMAIVPLPRNVAGFIAPLLAAGLASIGIPAVLLAAAAAYLAAWLMIRLSIATRALPTDGLEAEAAAG